MAAKDPYNETVWSKYYGPNLGYIQEKYEQFVKDPTLVEHNYRDLFTRSGPLHWLPMLNRHRCLWFQEILSGLERP